MHAAPAPRPIETPLPQSLVFMLAVMCGVSIASAYYAQPLLPTMGRAFNASEASMGLLPMFTQMGIGLGVFLLLPLGDIFDARKLVLVIVAAHVAALGAVASASSAGALNGFSLIMGFTTVTPYLIPALAAQLTPAAQRGQVTGMLARGIFSGILLARAVSGFVGYFLSWSAVYWMAMVAMTVMGFLFARAVPRVVVTVRVSYRQLLESLPRILRENRHLQVAALTQGLLFGGFNAFWISLAFHLESPQFQLPAYVAGLFGVVGLAGALAAPRYGRLADRRGAVFAVRTGTLITFSAWLVFAGFGDSLAGLVIGVLLLDLGTTACHVSNQALIYQLGAETRSRVTALYILGLFVGSAVVSPLAAVVWSHAGWAGVCVLGGVTTLLAVVVTHTLLTPSRSTARTA